jgi:hypothetical protein
MGACSVYTPSGSKLPDSIDWYGTQFGGTSTVNGGEGLVLPPKDQVWSCFCIEFVKLCLLIFHFFKDEESVAFNFANTCV